MADRRRQNSDMRMIGPKAAPNPAQAKATSPRMFERGSIASSAAMTATTSTPRRPSKTWVCAERPRPEPRPEYDRPERSTEPCPGAGHQPQDARARSYRQQSGDDGHHRYPQTTRQDLGLCREVAAEDLVPVFDQCRGTHPQLRGNG